MMPSVLRPLGLIALCLAGGFGRQAYGSLSLHEVRSSRFDLAITGGLEGVPAASPRYLRYSDIRALPSSKITATDEFARGRLELTVVFLADLWKVLPVKTGADCLLATCADGYAAVLPNEFIGKYRPFLVVEINGQPPEKWPGLGLKDDPGPYAITVSEDLVPDSKSYLSLEHKKPWSVVSIEFAAFRQAFAGAYEGRWAKISPKAAAGRQIWVNACSSCHVGPPDTFSGTQSTEPFPLLVAVARGDPEIFRRYVLEPTSVRPDSKMQPHSYFTREQLDSLIAFIVAEP